MTCKEGSAEPPTSTRSSLLLVALICSVLSACSHPASDPLPSAQLKITLHLSPMSRAWVEARKPQITLVAEEGESMTVMIEPHHIARLVPPSTPSSHPSSLPPSQTESLTSGPAGEGATLELLGFWGGSMTFTLSYLAPRESSPDDLKRVHYAIDFSASPQRSYHAVALERAQLIARQPQENSNDSLTEWHLWISPPSLVSAQGMKWSSILGLSEEHGWRTSPPTTPSRQPSEAQQSAEAFRYVWLGLIDSLPSADSSQIGEAYVFESWDLLPKVMSSLTDSSVMTSWRRLAEWGKRAQRASRERLQGARPYSTTLSMLRRLPCSLVKLTRGSKQGADPADHQRYVDQCEEERSDGPYITLIEHSELTTLREAERGDSPGVTREVTVEAYSLNDAPAVSLSAELVSPLGKAKSLDLDHRPPLQSPQPSAQHNQDITYIESPLPDLIARSSISWRDVNRPRIQVRLTASNALRHRASLSRWITFEHTPKMRLRGVASLMEPLSSGEVHIAPLEEMVARWGLAELDQESLHDLETSSWGAVIEESGVFQLELSGYVGPLWIEVRPTDSPAPPESAKLSTIITPSHHLSTSTLSDLETSRGDLEVTAWISPISDASVWLTRRSYNSLALARPSGSSDDLSVQVRELTRGVTHSLRQVIGWFEILTDASLSDVIRVDAETPQRDILLTPDAEQDSRWRRLLADQSRLSGCLDQLTSTLNMEAYSLFTPATFPPWQSLQDVELLAPDELLRAVLSWAPLLLKSCYQSSLERGDPISLSGFFAMALFSLLTDEPDQEMWRRQLSAELWVTRSRGGWARDDESGVWYVPEGPIEISVNASRGIGGLALGELASDQDSGAPSPSSLHAAEVSISDTSDSITSDSETNPLSPLMPAPCLWDKTQGATQIEALNTPEAIRRGDSSATWGEGSWRALSGRSLDRLLPERPTTAQLGWAWASPTSRGSDPPLPLDEVEARLPLPCHVKLEAKVDREVGLYQWLVSTLLWGVRDATRPDEEREARVLDALMELHPQIFKIVVDQSPPVITLRETRPERLEVTPTLDARSLTDAPSFPSHPHLFVNRSLGSLESITLLWETSEPSECEVATTPDAFEELATPEHSLELSALGDEHQGLFSSPLTSLSARALSEAHPTLSEREVSRRWSRFSRDLNGAMTQSPVELSDQWSVDLTPPDEGAHLFYVGCRDGVGEVSVTPVGLTLDSEAPRLNALTLEGLDERVLSHDAREPISSAPLTALARSIDLLSAPLIDEEIDVHTSARSAQWYRWSSHWRDCPRECEPDQSVLSLFVQGQDTTWRSPTLSVTLTGSLSVLTESRTSRAALTLTPLKVMLDQEGRARVDLYAWIRGVVMTFNPGLIPRLGETLIWRGEVKLSDPLGNAHVTPIRLDMYSIPPMVEVNYIAPALDIATKIAAGEWEALFFGELGEIQVNNPHDEELIVRLIPPSLQLTARYLTRDFGVTGDLLYDWTQDTCLNGAGGVPRQRFALTGFTAPSDPFDGFCVHLPTPPELGEVSSMLQPSHWELEAPWFTEGLRVPSDRVSSLELPRLIFEHSQYRQLERYITPPDEVPTDALPSTARYERFTDSPSFYLSYHHLSCGEVCDEPLLILGHHVSSLMYLQILETADLEIRQALTTYPLEVIERFGQDTWYLMVSAPSTSVYDISHSTLIPLPLHLTSEYDAEGQTE